MAATDVTGTTETAGVYGNLGAAKNTQHEAGIKGTDGTEMKVSPVAPGAYNPPPIPAVQPDTEAVSGGVNTHHKDDPAQNVEGTLDTTTGGPIVHVNPAYRVSGVTPSGTNVDTTWTDRPTTDGVKVPNEANKAMTGTLDTVNPSYPLKTTTTNRPAVPAAPTVVAGLLSVTVTVVQVADPAGAKVTGYRVEAARVLPTKTPGAVDALAVGSDWAPRGTAAAPATTSVVVSTLVPSETYVFRVAAINDNGSSDYSAWSAEAVPLAFDTVNRRYDDSGTYVAASGSAVDVNPQYKPDGSTYGPGQVATLTLTDTAVVGELKVDWTAPASGPAVTSYRVSLSGGATVSKAAGSITHTFTGQTSGVNQTATIVPLSNRGPGAARTSAADSPDWSAMRRR